MNYKQVIIYIVYAILQIIIGITLLGSNGIPVLGELLGPLMFIGILSLLCNYKYFIIANILVGLSIMIGIFEDYLYLKCKQNCKWPLPTCFACINLQSHSSHLQFSCPVGCIQSVY